MTTPPQAQTLRQVLLAVDPEAVRLSDGAAVWDLENFLRQHREADSDYLDRPVVLREDGTFGEEEGSGFQAQPARLRLVRHPLAVRAEVLDWDRRDVNRLNQLLEEMESGLTDNEELGDFLDPADVPSADPPPGLESDHPLWAVDEAGFALVGREAREVRRVEDLPREA
jgi:hypothetical protein